MDNRFAKFVFVTYFFLAGLLLLLLVKGPVEQFDLRQNESFPVGGPFESSGSRSRYATTQALAEGKTVFLDPDQAKFAAPDVSEADGRFFSLFPPGVSLLGLPFYYLGSVVGAPQLITYLSTALFALLNVLLIYLLARKLDVGPYVALFSSFLFLFATNALAYSQSFIQHHASTVVILLIVLSYLRPRSVINNLVFGMLLGVGLLLDLSNLIILLPVFLYLAKAHLKIRERLNSYQLSIKLSLVAVLLGIAPFLTAYGLYNYVTVGSPVLPAQLVGRTAHFLDLTEEQLEEERPDSLSLPYKPRNMLNGIYILLFSNQRGILFYSPVLLIGLLGLWQLHKLGDTDKLLLFTGLLLMLLFSYSMFGDPWGGWSFGPRYLIPGFALLAILAGIAVQHYRANWRFLILLGILTLYSLGVNIVGATTTTLVPPKVEAETLLSQIPYTYEYNLDLINNGIVSPLIYNRYLNSLFSAKTFVLLYYAFVSVMFSALFMLSVKHSKSKP